MTLTVNAPEEAIEAALIVATAYTGASTIAVDELLTRKHPGTREDLPVAIPVYGAILQTIEMSRDDGTTQPSVRSIFRVIHPFTGAEEYISFVSVAAFNFVKNTIAKVRPMGDWDRPLYFLIREKKLDKGSTYNFQMVQAPVEVDRG
jgi:hypothetical protein